MNLLILCLVFCKASFTISIRLRIFLSVFPSSLKTLPRYYKLATMICVGKRLYRWRKGAIPFRMTHFETLAVRNWTWHSGPSPIAVSLNTNVIRANLIRFDETENWMQILSCDDMISIFAFHPEAIRIISTAPRNIFHATLFFLIKKFFSLPSAVVIKSGSKANFKSSNQMKSFGLVLQIEDQHFPTQ